MKTVIETPFESVIADDVTPRHYIGILENKDFPSKGKGFITRERYNSGKFVCRVMNSVTLANGWTNIHSDSLIILVKELLRRNFGVYVFNSGREFVQWLLDDASLA